jgi:hypothetical protein
MPPGFGHSRVEEVVGKGGEAMESHSHLGSLTGAKERKAGDGMGSVVGCGLLSWRDRWGEEMANRLR